MKRLAFVALLVSSSAVAMPPLKIIGTVTHVRDGDTLVVDGLPIRLSGIAAPERYAPGGREATAAMVALVDGRRVACELTGETSHDRMVGSCSVLGSDLGDAMIAGLHARRCAAFDPAGRYPELPSTLPLPAYCVSKQQP